MSRQPLFYRWRKRLLLPTPTRSSKLKPFRSRVSRAGALHAMGLLLLATTLFITFLGTTAAGFSTMSAFFSAYSALSKPHRSDPRAIEVARHAAPGQSTFNVLISEQREQNFRFVFHVTAVEAPLILSATIVVVSSRPPHGAMVTVTFEALAHVVLALPFCAVVLFCCYSLATIGFGLATFPDRLDAHTDLLKDIDAAHAALKERGFNSW